MARRTGVATASYLIQLGKLSCTGHYMNWITPVKTRSILTVPRHPGKSWSVARAHKRGRSQTAGLTPWRTMIMSLRNLHDADPPSLEGLMPGLLHG